MPISLRAKPIRAGFPRPANYFIEGGIDIQRPLIVNRPATFIVILGLAVTPGPNMIYLISRSIAQGRTAGIISLGGSALGFVVYMACAAFGITALLMAVLMAYEVLRIAGVEYLMVLAWQAVRPGGRSPFQANALPSSGHRKVLAMRFVTTILNPKAALLYLALLPQFVVPDHGSILSQT